MPINIRYDREAGILRADVGGVISPADYKDALEHICSSSEYSSDTPTIWDLRELDFASVESHEVERFRAVRAQFPQRKYVRIACVVPGTLGYGMMRMFQVLTDTNDPDLFLVTYDYDEAERWLSRQVEETP